MDNIPTNLDLTRFTEFERITVTHEWDLISMANDGWRLIAIGTVRPSPDTDGSFTDKFVAILGREPT